MARIAIGGFLHETNCFVDMRTDYNYYASGGEFPPLARGEQVIERTLGAPFGISGFLDEMGDLHDLVPLVWGHGGAGGYITDDCFERIVGELIGKLSEALEVAPLDAIYLDLHGAMCSETFPDAEGELLRRVRASVGPDTPVVITLDYHVNLTDQMLRNCDGIAIYLTYPHIDRQHTGGRSARILKRILEEGIPKGKAIRRIPFLLPLNFQCTLIEPTKSIIEASIAAETGSVVNLSYGAGFPPSDLYECGPAVVCHAYSQESADKAADMLESMILQREADFSEPLMEPDTAVLKAIEISKTAKGPVIIADTQDNPGCGGTGDTTGLLEALVRHGAEGVAMCVMCDPAAADMASKAGIDAEVTLDLGGKQHVEGVSPYHGTYRVMALSDGQFTTTGKSIPGRKVNIGPVALLKIDDIEIVVASKRMQAYDQDIFKHIGVEPAEKKILVLKSTCHFRADFDPISSATLVAIAPGAHIVDPRVYSYKYLREGVRLLPKGETHERPI
ncbi:MAG: microcystin degradation protein MlrC [Magnetovibrio sp.]|nr:microcystin degradation protein MlrC [Magnetovibrio sp.]